MTTFYMPTQVVIGEDTLDQLPDLIRQYGKRPLLVHGHRPVEDGLLEKVRTTLNEAHIPHSNMGQILPNPKYDSVKRGAKIAKEEGCDLILSLGGGSTLHCAKGIAYAMKFKGKHLWDLWTGKEKPHGMMPVAAILTDPASGSELNNSCTLVKDGEQKTLISPVGYCTFAILDPSLSILPLYPTMSQSFEMFAYIFMRYLDAENMEEQMDLAIMSSLLNNTKLLESDQSNLQARTGLFWCGFMSHSMHQKSTSSLEELANDLAFHHSLPSGVALAAVFFPWCEEKIKEKTSHFAKMARYVFEIQTENEETQARLGLQAMKQRVEQMGLATTIPGTGLVLSEKDLKKIAHSSEDLALLKQANQPNPSNASEEASAASGHEDLAEPTEQEVESTESAA